MPRHNTIMVLPGLLHPVRRHYDFRLNISCFAIQKRVTQKFSKWMLLPVITIYVRPYVQLLVDKGLIQDVWTSSGMNVSYYSTCLHHRLCNIHKSWCLHFFGENLEGNKKMAKFVVEWYNSIGLFNKQTYIVPVNPISVIFCHKQYRACPLKQNFFGWFTYKGFLAATCWNNRTVRLESAAGKPSINFLWAVYMVYTLKTKSHHDANSVVIDGTSGCRYDKHQCWAWRQCREIALV